MLDRLDAYRAVRRREITNARRVDHFADAQTPGFGRCTAEDPLGEGVRHAAVASAPASVANPRPSSSGRPGKVSDPYLSGGAGRVNAQPSKDVDPNETKEPA